MLFRSVLALLALFTPSSSRPLDSVCQYYTCLRSDLQPFRMAAGEVTLDRLLCFFLVSILSFDSMNSVLVG